MGFTAQKSSSTDQTDAMDPMSPKLKRKSSNRNRDNRNRDSSAARQPVKAHELRPGNIVWLPQSAIEKSHKILQFEHRRNVQSTDIDQALREEAKNRHNVQSTKIDQGLREAAYNHPVVVLQIINPHSRYSDGDDDYVVVSMVSNTSGNPHDMICLFERNQKKS